jgi:2-octaprenyl-6-methoxyphenol hydroxylase
LLREIGLDVFGYNIENRVLVSALEERAAELSNLTRFDDDAATVAPEDRLVAIHLVGGGSLFALLAVGADGRQSLCREAAGIGVKRRELHQTALTFNIMSIPGKPTIHTPLAFSFPARRPLQRGGVSSPRKPSG